MTWCQEYRRIYDSSVSVAKLLIMTIFDVFQREGKKMHICRGKQPFDILLVSQNSRLKGSRNFKKIIRDRSQIMFAKKEWRGVANCKHFANIGR